MRDVIDDRGRGSRSAAVFAAVATVVISATVAYNAIYAQPPGNRNFADAGKTPGGVTRQSVDVGSTGGQTIQLRYDPVVEQVQRELLTSGYYKGIVDGVVGRRTKDAIAAYQQAAGLAVTGEPSPELAEHIRYTREVAEASIFTGSVSADADAEQRAQIRRVQTGLSELAYAPGAVTGELNDATRTAIRKFQKDRGLAETGEISEALMTELAKLSGQSELLSN
ncbi:MAG: peptidoglycan-binding protein [Rhizobiales bacterium]|nr:peptidoglycan-binding protein [Hyphomicrobiales bacterium]MBI3673712.1 peptidoglycan-binding protein [Hyphomicrobiales bacterium]